jgi:hypothetical protein
MENLNYDGFYFLPYENDVDSLNFTYFKVKGDNHGEPIEGNQVGDKYHVVMFKEGEDGMPVFDDSFEAILGDPTKYVENLIGTEIYGCVLRKTKNSGKWIENYLTDVLGSVIMKKLNYLK